MTPTQIGPQEKTKVSKLTQAKGVHAAYRNVTLRTFYVPVVVKFS